FLVAAFVHTGAIFDKSNNEEKLLLSCEGAITSWSRLRGKIVKEEKRGGCLVLARTTVGPGDSKDEEAPRLRKIAFLFDLINVVPRISEEAHFSEVLSGNM
ncbi:hypothetical protein H0E87_025211, partial [Populus deltoides]